MEQEIERAAKELPQGWELSVCIEGGAAWVHLFRPDTIEVVTDPELMEGTLVEQVTKSIEYAKVHS